MIDQTNERFMAEKSISARKFFYLGWRRASYIVPPSDWLYDATRIFHENGWCNKCRPVRRLVFFSPHGLRPPLLCSSALSSFVSSRRLLTRRLGIGCGVRLRKIVHHPYLFGLRLPLQDEVSLSFRSSFSSTEEVCLSDKEKLLNARLPSRLWPTKENDRFF